ncbi:MAG: hypothetical protein BZY88_09180 [SAR202 cluster bacterium Io17-Chloro-G9]|nr:MAG: hypothetical protein BZY88_09180 [SAR202 cluster bacterium Io17-Chloro-G9]
MSKIVAIRIRTADPLTYADARDLDLRPRKYVVVQGEKGPEVGQVVRDPQDVVWAQTEDKMPPAVLRVASASDLGNLQRNQEMERDAFVLARSKARDLGLAMKIVEARYTFDRTRLTVSFGAEGRVDFRPLIRELGSALRCRVELRQVGDRDVAKLTGGIGKCGRVLCCVTWMDKFESVSIRMAKEQALPINADGLAGACGRLRCCLRFEYEQYREINKAMPRIGEEVGTPDGKAKVIVGHRLKETVSVQYTDDRVFEWPLDRLERFPASRN